MDNDMLCFLHDIKNVEELRAFYEIEDEVIFYTEATRWFNSSVFSCGDLILTNKALLYKPNGNDYGVTYMNRERLAERLAEKLVITLDSIVEIKPKNTLLFIPNKLWITTSNSETVYKFGGMQIKKRKEFISLLKEKCHIDLNNSAIT